MLLTLNASSLRAKLVPGDLGLMDIPRFARETLGVHGINLSTDLIAGRSRSEVEALRERADKAGCACLVLIENEPLAVGSGDDDEGDGAADRAIKIARAAGLLGCNAAAVRCAGGADEVSVSLAIERLKHVMESVERLELNLLIAPHKGMTHEPDMVSNLIKRVGGFRIGTLPDFADAHASGDAEAYLRRITPYASCVVAAARDFVLKGKSTPAGDDLSAPIEHRPWNLAEMVAAVESVGYASPLAIEYRGKGDPVLGILRARGLLEEALKKDAGAS